MNVTVRMGVSLFHCPILPSSMFPPSSVGSESVVWWSANREVTFDALAGPDRGWDVF